LRAFINYTYLLNRRQQTAHAAGHQPMAAPCISSSLTTSRAWRPLANILDANADIANAARCRANYRKMTSSTNRKYITSSIVVGRGLSHGPGITCTKNFVNFKLWFFEISDRTDRQTDTQTYTIIAILRTPPEGEVLCHWHSDGHVSIHFYV